MGFDIYRLVVEWPETVSAFRQHRGGAFFWTLVDPEAGFRGSFLREYEGALSNLPSAREFDASSIYEDLRPHLDESVRAQCDGCFSALFWPDGPGIGTNTHDLEAATGLDGDDLFCTMSPATVLDVLERVRRLPSTLLEAAHEKAGGPHGEYLTDFEEFFVNHVGNHQQQLEHASSRGAGLVALLSV